MSNKIKIRRGSKSALPLANTVIGELRYATDTKELYIDDGVSNVSLAVELTDGISTATQTALDLKEDLANKGVADGYAELDSSGYVPSSQLPSYVDDVLEYADFASLPATGETGKIYITLDDNKTYRWSGTVYVEISASLALGETSSTAYRGDRGKIAYDHSLLTTGNPHNVTLSDVGGTTDHTLLTNIGTNTHVQLDSHLASTANPHSVTYTQVGADPTGTDNSTNITLAGTLDYLTLSGQEITLNQIDLTTDVTGLLPSANIADDFLKNDGDTGIGNYIFRSATNSTTALQIQQADTTTILNVDTVNAIAEVTGNIKITNTSYPANIGAFRTTGKAFNISAANGEGEFRFDNTGKFNIASQDRAGINSQIYDASVVRHLTILSSGEVGIGTVSPRDKLTVAGGVAPYTHDLYDLGTSSYKWDDVYATNGTIITSDLDRKDSIEGSDLGLDFINGLRPVKYKWKDYTSIEEQEITLEDENGETYTTIETTNTDHTFTRKHYGIIAQEVEELLNGKDFAGLIKNDEGYGLRYNEFISPIVKAIQEITTRLEALES